MRGKEGNEDAAARGILSKAETALGRSMDRACQEYRELGKGGTPAAVEVVETLATTISALRRAQNIVRWARERMESK